MARGYGCCIVPGRLSQSAGDVLPMSRRRSARTEPTAQAERQRKEIKHQRDELAVEKSAVSRTHQLVVQLTAAEDFQSLLGEVLDAAIEIQNADFGTLQLYNPETESLEIAAQRGFRRDFLEHFNRVDDRTSACGRAMLTRKRVIIEDVQTDPGFASHRQTADAAGFRAVQSTPMFNRQGRLLGMVSTHFRKPHQPSEHELELTDLYVGIAAELIRRQRAERLARQNEERFGRLAEGIRDYAIYQLDPAGRIAKWNVGAQRLFGYSESEVLGTHFSRFSPPGEDEQQKAKEALQLAEERGSFASEGWRLRKDGTRFWSSGVLTALRTPGSELTGFSKLIHDLTEQRRTQEAIETARAELARVQRLSTLGTVTGLIAHQINQPLTTMQTNSDALISMLERNPTDVNELKEIAGEIAEAATKSKEIITQIREFFRQGLPEKIAIDLNSVIRQAVSLASAELRKYEIEAQVDLRAEELMVSGRPAEFLFIVGNLLTNGIEAINSGTPKSRILMIRSMRSDCGDVLVAVEDSGPGIKSHDADVIFELFSSSKPHGMGLGLAISRAIIEAHGGKLWAVSEPGQGATFQFTLPPVR